MKTINILIHVENNTYFLYVKQLNFEEYILYAKMEFNYPTIRC
jgi:hypothetical protein